MIGHVRVEGPVHLMHGQEAKIQKARTPYTKAKAKAKIPRTKMSQEGNSCKGQDTLKISLTTPWNGTKNFAGTRAKMTSRTIVGSTKFSNIFD